MLKRVGYNLYAHKSNIKELRSKLTEEMNVQLAEAKDNAKTNYNESLAEYKEQRFFQGCAVQVCFQTEEA